MRVIRLADLPVMVHIRRRDEVLVAVPVRLPEDDILAIASVVLSGDEFAELAGSLDRGHDGRTAPPHG
ncbi:hypothetical protein GA0070624_5396 [Micromonospora rhizosphaerae]|uniref:Uncharacterized protein n=1 Tax=Micromonospora rhizosphaerae TaxID=568872 RepID=A0A1C6T258_9ACTN|nr:hypothetical protein [Micromonospora rhizosphaerae]SCL35904.1 hypothetical protein GA0070624_5396 [Micromonospora rhizosphaerae]